MEPITSAVCTFYQVIGHTKRMPRTNIMDNDFYCIQSKDILTRWCSAENLQLEPIASRIDFSKRTLFIIGKETTDSTNFIGITSVTKTNDAINVYLKEININSRASREPAPGYSAAFLAIDKNIRFHRVRIKHDGLFNLSDLDEKVEKEKNSKAECHASRQKPSPREIVNRTSGPLFQ